MNGTIKAIVGCALTLLLLGGFVTYLETRLPSETKRECQEERRLNEEASQRVGAITKKVNAELKAHSDLFGETAKTERWVELLKLAEVDLVAGELKFAQEIQPLLQKNSREDEERLHELLDELFKAREEALKSVAHLEARVKELAEILPRAAKSYADLGKRLAFAQESVSKLETSISELAGKVPETQPILEREKWQPHLQTCAAALSALIAKHADLKGTLDKHTLEGAKEVLKAIKSLDHEQASATARRGQIGSRFESLKTFVTNRAAYAKQVEGNLAALRGLPFAEIEKKGDELAKRYPFNGAEIKRRVKAFLSLEASAIRAAERTQAALKLPLAKSNPGAILKDLKHVAKRREAAPKVLAALRKQLAELDISYEKILVDMQIKEAAEVTFRQQFLEIAATRGVPQVKSKATWVNVDKKAYKLLEKMLGVATVVKPYGYFANQGERMGAAPAGMRYLGNPAYGAWENDTWRFNKDPQTQALVTAAWGSHYPGHTRTDYTTFQHANKRTWVGRDRWGHAQYGSKGSLTALVFATSLYVRNKGYVSTRYHKSGGRYRGTRYETRRSTTVFVGGSRSRGYSSRSSRRTSYGK